MKFYIKHESRGRIRIHLAQKRMSSVQAETLLAYVVSLCIYQIGNLFIGGGFGIGTVVAVLLIIGFVYLLVRPYKESATLSVSTNKMFSK